MKKYIYLFLASTLTLGSCDDLLKPAPENFKDVEQMYDDAKYAQGFLVNVYRCIPGYYDNTEYATDDAVVNQTSNTFRTMATGGWTASSSSSVNQWKNCYSSIQYINLFLQNADQVKWSDNTNKNALFLRRTKGEAYGLRGMFMYYLLRSHAGFNEKGELLGVPIYNEYLESTSNFNQARASFADCVKQALADFSKAEEMLPYEYEDIASNEEIPESFLTETDDFEAYNTVMGRKARQLFNGLIARAYRTRLLILAASPAFQDASNPTTWADAAQAAADVLAYNGGLNGLASNGVEYYSATIADATKDGINPDEIIWRENVSSSSSQETNFFPPSLFGSGMMNPSQNLVDAFPMANGYPISDTENSGYNSATPYIDRDPRLALYIIYNGAKAGVSSSTIYTSSKSTTDDGINKVEQKSTRTGYYMKKRLRMDVNCNPSSSSKKNHFTPRIRYTEMYLDYAEAANEAWGPKDRQANSYSAYDVIKAIRQRAGVGGTNDPYLEACAANKDLMRTLIQNERRLELCFEGFRFWDLRRWNTPLNETVMGIDWAVDGSTYSLIEVEERKYEDYMRYCPIPYSELLKYNKLEQNKGWK